MYIFLDESGDLGFNFKKMGTSTYFVISVLVCHEQIITYKIRKAVKKTLRLKIHMNKKYRMINELKGSEISLGAKKYFYNLINVIPDWNLYNIVVDKKLFIVPKYIAKKTHLYDLLAGYLFNKVQPTYGKDKIIITVDKCKTSNEVVRFNQYIANMIYPKISNELIINHVESYNDGMLQAIDLFCHGVYRKYEYNDRSWYDYFRERILLEGFVK